MSFLESLRQESEAETGGRIKGIAVATVTDNNDPDRLCRVKVSYPWHDQPTESYWARLVTPMAGASRGLVLIPEVGDEVVVGFDREDIRFPYVLGALWNGKDKPPVANDDGRNDARKLVSRKKHYLLFDDGAQGVVELAHEKGRKVTFDDSGIALADEKGNTVRIDSNSSAITVEAKGQLKIKAASVTIEATGTLELKANATLSVRGSIVNIN